MMNLTFKSNSHFVSKDPWMIPQQVIRITAEKKSTALRAIFFYEYRRKIICN